MAPPYEAGHASSQTIAVWETVALSASNIA